MKDITYYPLERGFLLHVDDATYYPPETKKPPAGAVLLEHCTGHRKVTFHLPNTPSHVAPDVPPATPIPPPAAYRSPRYAHLVERVVQSLQAGDVILHVAGRPGTNTRLVGRLNERATARHLKVSHYTLGHALQQVAPLL